MSKSNRSGKRVKNKNSKKQKLILIVLELFFVILMIFSGIEIYKWWNDNRTTQNMLSDLSNKVTVTGTNGENSKIENNENANSGLVYNVDFKSLKEINSDTVAWLKVNGIEIEYPIVKAKNNSYYLNHGFDKRYNEAGWIFADYKNKVDGTDKNLVIYGHNRKDGSMFAPLHNILKEEWYKKEENKLITLVTENATYKYQVFSIYQIEKEDYYIQTDFSTTNFNNFINNLKNRSITDFAVEVEEGDKILTLSTCANDNNYRVVLHGKLLVEY